jgi:hypothetical protein
MKKVKVTGVQILTSSMRFLSTLINFVTKSTGLQYLKELYGYPNFFT